jgi:hypothetical protein
VDYEEMPYEELREKAFDCAEERHDVTFFYDLFTHTQAMRDVSSEGGSLGDISGTLIELVRAAHEMFQEENVGDLEPLFVAKYATYLRAHCDK